MRIDEELRKPELKLVADTDADANVDASGTPLELVELNPEPAAAEPVEPDSAPEPAAPVGEPAPAPVPEPEPEPELEAKPAPPTFGGVPMADADLVNTKVKSHLIAFGRYALEEAENHKVPLAVFLTLLIFPKLLLVWVPLALTWSVFEFLHRRLPPPLQKRAEAMVPQTVRNSKVARDLMEGLVQVRPFMLGALYIFCIPFALVWMFTHWVMKLFGLKLETPARYQAKDERIAFHIGSRKSDDEEESNFFHSPAFAIVAMLVMACGLPAAITYLLYQHLGIDALLGHPSADPRFFKSFVFGQLYIYGVAVCISIFFLRSWFVFPLNFLNDEETIEIDGRGVQRRRHGWLMPALTWNCPWAGADSLDWENIKAIHYENTARPLYPLPKESFPENSFFYAVMNKLAAISDGITKQADRPDYVIFSTARAKGAVGSKLRLNLQHLDGDQRAHLFYAIRNWAPDVLVDEEAQQSLLGSTVLQAPQYTQLWFQLLADDMQVKHAGLLSPGDKLRDGTITVSQRLASGGQANVYSAVTADGDELVLKEFILSTSDAVGALVESAAEFETETTLLSAIQHDRIVRMLDFFASSRRLYIVLEKVKGSSLRQLVKGEHGPLSEKQTIDIALQVCEALQYLHRQEPAVVHRDIAPDNIMFSEEEGVKLIDFSLAAARKVRQTTSTMGKHSYAPPEQFREQPCPQSDIYALGATMYFLLTGEDPKPITVSDVCEKRPDVGEKLAAIIKQATAFNVEDRYASVQWLQLELEAL